MVAVDDRLALRHERQRSVEALLAELDERRRTVYRLLAAGALPAGLREVKADIAALQRNLAALTLRRGAATGSARSARRS